MAAVFIPSFERTIGGVAVQQIKSLHGPGYNSGRGVDDITEAQCFCVAVTVIVHGPVAVSCNFFTAHVIYQLFSIGLGGQVKKTVVAGRDCGIDKVDIFTGIHYSIQVRINPGLDKTPFIRQTDIGVVIPLADDV